MRPTNLMLHVHCRRLMRLTNAFSKKQENFEAAIATNFCYYNFVNKLFQWSAIATSSFVLLAALLMSGGTTEYGMDWEEWFLIASVILAPICALVCIASAILGYFKEKRKNSN